MDSAPGCPGFARVRGGGGAPAGCPLYRIEGVGDLIVHISYTSRRHEENAGWVSNALADTHIVNDQAKTIHGMKNEIDGDLESFRSRDFRSEQLEKASEVKTKMKFGRQRPGGAIGE